MTAGFEWTREDSPRWDADKQRVFGPAEIAATGLTPPAAGAPVADEWWHVTDAAGTIVGYGWLDSEWGDAEVTFVVAPGRRGQRIGEFIVDHLEAEAAAQGLNYIYNVVPATNPDPDWVRAWLLARGFTDGDGDLRRRVRENTAS
jgi:ribosomal protein S18 acetylase RimI-like enzyme